MSLELPTDPTIEVHETRAFYIWLDAEGIVRTLCKHVTTTLLDAQEHVAVSTTLGQGSPLPHVVDIAQVVSADREFRHYNSTPAAVAAYKAVVLLVDSPVSHIMGNFFLGLNKPSYPLKLFTDETKALAWLKTFLD